VSKNAITALKAYAKVDQRPLNYGALIAQIKGETDRSAVIILASTVEDVLVEALLGRLKGASSELRSGLLDWTGPLGTFSGRIKIARAFEVIDQPTYRDLEDMREMRNACAHSPKPLSFEIEALRNAVVAMCERPQGFQNVTLPLIRKQDYRRAFLTHTACLIAAVRGGSRVVAFQALAATLAKRKARGIDDEA
jgi:DNA-binding MltR family transcriptional regulator